MKHYFSFYLLISISASLAMESKEQRLEKYETTKKLILNARKDETLLINGLILSYKIIQQLREQLTLSINKKIPTETDSEKVAFLTNQLTQEKRIFRGMDAIRKHIKYPKRPLEHPLDKIFSDATVIEETESAAKTFNEFIEQQWRTYYN